MMDCKQARLLIGGDPHALTPELEAHLRGCPSDRGFREEMLALDANILRALEHGVVLSGESPRDQAGAAPQLGVSTLGTLATDAVVTKATAVTAQAPASLTPASPTPSTKASAAAAPVMPSPIQSVPMAAAPAGAPTLAQEAVMVQPNAATGTSNMSPANVIPFATDRRSAAPPVRRWSGWTLAAGVLVAALGLGVWALRPNESLAHEIVDHVEHEPASWTATEPIPPASLNTLLSKAGVELETNSDKVRYARSCVFRGRQVPHLVVDTSQGPTTVMILPHVRVKTAQSFQEDGLTGVILPEPNGSIAVLEQGHGDINEAAQQINQSVRWIASRAP